MLYFFVISNLDLMGFEMIDYLITAVIPILCIAPISPIELKA